MRNRRSECEGHADATITTARGVVLDTEIRDDARLIVDDTTLAAAPWERVRPVTPPTFDGWRVGNTCCAPT